MSGGLLLLEFVELGGLLLALIFELRHDAGLGPASLGGKVTKSAEFSVSLQSEHLEGLGNDNALLVVVGEGHAFEDLQLTESGGATSELVGEHATDALPENARRGPPVLVTAAGVRVNTLLHNILTNDLVSLDPAGLDDLLSTHNSDALAGQKLLGNNAGETALKTLRLKAQRKFVSLGDLAALTGWTKQDVVAALEEKRKVKSAAFHTLKTKKMDARAKASKDKSVAPFNAELAKFGF